MSHLRRLCAAVLSCGFVCLAQTDEPQPVLKLTLRKAIEIATSSHGNTAVLLAREAEKLSLARAGGARANLLPSLGVSVAEQNQTVNPRALGLRFSSPLFTVPNSVGPFNTFDARVQLREDLLDLSSIRRWRAARADTQASMEETASAREETGVSVARLYAAVLRANARIAIANTNLTEARAMLDHARRRAAAGEGTDLEVSRATLNVSRSRERVLMAQTERDRAELDLIAAMHIDWNMKLELTGTLDAAQAPLPGLAGSLATALRSRADIRVEEKRIESARLSGRAASLERMPSLAVYGDYGDLQGVQTHTIGAALRIPIFNGGRIASDKAEAASLLRQEQIRQEGLRSRVELEVRKALASWKAAAEQLQVAGESIQVAEQELASARRHYAAGLTNSTEVIEAQRQLAAARNDRVEALFHYANARIDWAQATGTIAQLTI